MSLLTACGELRCTATLSGHGERGGRKERRGERSGGRIGLCAERLVSNEVTAVVNYMKS